jgi:ribokinase
VASGVQGEPGAIVGTGWATFDRMYRRLSSAVALDADSSEMVEFVAEGGGGRAATAIVTAATLGWRTRFVGTIGDDDIGRHIRDEFKRTGVDVTDLLGIEGGRSAHSTVLVSAGGARLILFDPGTCSFERTSTDSGRLLDGAAALLIEDGPTYPGELVAEAKRRAIPVLLDLDRTAPHGTGEWTGKGTIVVASSVYLAITGLDPDAAIAQLLEYGAHIAVVTLGARGAIGTDGTLRHFEPSIEVDVVDTTGAGDVYHGAFIVGFLESGDLVHSMRVAAIAAGLSCRGYGGRAALPARGDLERWY